MDTNFDSSPPSATAVVNENAVTTIPPVAFDEGLNTAITYGSAAAVDGDCGLSGWGGHQMRGLRKRYEWGLNIVDSLGIVMVGHHSQ